MNTKIEITANVPKPEAWNVLFDEFGEVNNFNPLIIASKQTGGPKGSVGCERRCDLDEKNYVLERITSVNGTESFDIEIYEGGLPMMKSMFATVYVNEIDPGSTKITFKVNFKTSPGFMAGMMKGMMIKTFKKMLIGLKYHLETGGLVNKNNIKEIVKGYKLLGEKEGFGNSLAA